MSPHPTYAAIDIGSNAIRFLIARIVTDDSGVRLQRLYFDRVAFSLGREAFGDGAICPASGKKLIEILRGLRDEMARRHVTQYRAYATEALRVARNRGEIIASASREAGVDITILDEEWEARLIADLAQYEGYRPPFFVFDIGGGSTEFAFVETPGEVVWESFKIAGLRGGEDAAEFTRLSRWLGDLSVRGEMIAVGGTMMTVARSLGASGKVTRAQLQDLVRQNAECTLQQRADYFNVAGDKIPIIDVGCRVCHFVMERLDYDLLTAVSVGVSEGMIWRQYEEREERGR